MNDLLAGWFVIISRDRSAGKSSCVFFLADVEEEAAGCFFFFSRLERSSVCFIESVRHTLAKLITLYCSVLYKKRSACNFLVACRDVNVKLVILTEIRARWQRRGCKNINVAAFDYNCLIAQIHRGLMCSALTVTT